ncbi:hypothetical protein [Acinetobacter sp. NigerLNRRAM0016]
MNMLSTYAPEAKAKSSRPVLGVDYQQCPCGLMAYKKIPLQNKKGFMWICRDGHSQNVIDCSVN